jgi:hypothetical protein
VAYALRKWTPTVEKKVAELVKAAVSRSLPRPPRPATVVDDSNVSTANEIRGASWGANAGRHEATPGHSQPLSVQLDTTSGHARHRLTTAWKCLLSSGPQVQVMLEAQVTRYFRCRFTVREPAGEPIAWRQPWRNGRVFGPAWMGANRTGSAVPARRSGRCRGDDLARMPGGFQLPQTTQIADSERVASRLN